MSQEKFQNHVAAIAELSDSRIEEAQRAKDLIVTYRKEIETKDQEIEGRFRTFLRENVPQTIFNRLQLKFLFT